MKPKFKKETGLSDLEEICQKEAIREKIRDLPTNISRKPNMQ